MSFTAWRFARKAGRELVTARGFEWDMGFGEVCAWPDDPVGDRGLREEKGARDFGGGESDQETQREHDAAFSGENRTTSD